MIPNMNNDLHNVHNDLFFMQLNQQRMMKLKEIEMTSKTPEEAKQRLDEMCKQENEGAKIGLILGTIGFILILCLLW